LLDDFGPAWGPARQNASVSGESEMAETPEKAAPAGGTPPSPPKPAAAPAPAASAPAAGAATATATAPPKPAAPGAPAAAPPRPRPKVQLVWEPKELHRRDWLLATSWILFAISSLAGTLFYVLRFLFPNVTYEPPLQFKAGMPNEFAPGRVDERFKEGFGTWIVRNELGLYALSTTCTHLGCTPNWLDGEQKFKCPCHGSGFRKTGINFEGPAPRPLERYRIGRADDGQVLVDKSVKFQGEKGEWANPESFLYV
jgi:cytochrome b6-f complex iron-sulfur subunit